MSDPEATANSTQLLAYLDEMLPVEEASQLEQRMRSQPELLVQLAALIRERDQGGHSVGDIWRRHRLSCPSRAELGRLLLKITSPRETDYIQFHLNEIGCRLCQANLLDLQQSQIEESPKREIRQRRYFESSAGIIRNRTNEH